MDELGPAHSWGRVGVARQEDEYGVIIHVVEAMAIATLHTYIDSIYRFIYSNWDLLMRGS